MFSQSLVKGYDTASICPRCLMKIDIRKAFDSFQWDFIKNAILALKFPVQFVDWIMGCISSSWFSIKINGNIKRFFNGESGASWQGDPLSPYLFVIRWKFFHVI